MLTFSTEDFARPEPFDRLLSPPPGAPETAAPFSSLTFPEIAPVDPPWANALPIRARMTARAKNKLANMPEPHSFLLMFKIPFLCQTSSTGDGFKVVGEWKNPSTENGFKVVGE